MSKTAEHLACKTMHEQFCEIFGLEHKPLTSEEIAKIDAAWEAEHASMMRELYGDEPAPPKDTTPCDT